MARTTPALMLMYGKEASNRKQEIDRHKVISGGNTVASKAVKVPFTPRILYPKITAELIATTPGID